MRDEQPPPPGAERPTAPRRDDLAGAQRTGLTAEAAMRARDVDRPDAADLARAENKLVIVRRNWTPPPV